MNEAILALTPIEPLVIDGCRAIAPCLAIGRDEALGGDPSRLDAVRALAVWSTIVDEVLLDRLPALELVANFGVGYDKVDVGTATARGVAVTHTPGVLDDEVADLAVGLLLMTIRRLGEAERYVRGGHWAEGPFPLTATLRGRTVGILGMGRIGSAIARRLEGFKVDIAYCSRNPREALAYAYHPDAASLAEAVDTLICMLPGGPETRHAIDAGVLAQLGPDGVVINVGRGSSLDEAALAEALRSGTIAAAGLDVFEQEPFADHPLAAFDNVVLLPHVGSATVHTRAAMGQMVVDNIASWFANGFALTATPETVAAGLDLRDGRRAR